MKYELEHLELLCKDEKLQKLDEKHLLLQSISAESDLIKGLWKNKILSSSNEHAKEQYIQDHQKGIIVLTESIRAKIKSSIELPFSHTHLMDYLALCKNIYHNLEQLLNYLEEYFPRFFNYEANVPAHLKRADLVLIKKQLAEIEKLFTQKKVTTPLTAIIIKVINNFLHEGVSKATFKRVQYFKQLTEALKEITNINIEASEFDSKLDEILFFNNFNSFIYFNYCTTRITKSLEGEETFEKRLSKLAFELKLNKQSPVKPGLIFDLDYISIKDQLTHWIQEEINYLERTKQLAIPFQANVQKANKSNFKIVMNMSVAQVAYLIKLLKEGAIIENQNTNELLRFIATIIKTKKSDDLSQGALRTKYYSVESSTEDSVKKMLSNLVNSHNNH